MRQITEFIKTTVLGGFLVLLPVVAVLAVIGVSLAALIKIVTPIAVPYLSRSCYLHVPSSFPMECHYRPVLTLSCLSKKNQYPNELACQWEFYEFS